MPPRLVRTSPPHASLPPWTKGVYDFKSNFMTGKDRPRGQTKTTGADSIKHDLHYVGLDATNAAQMVFDRPQRKAFVNGQPARKFEQGSCIKSRILSQAIFRSMLFNYTNLLYPLFNIRYGQRQLHHTSPQPNS